jgi:hypothetical protein
MSDLPLIAFDVNETLVDLETMAPTCGRDGLWFSNLMPLPLQ